MVLIIDHLHTILLIITTILGIMSVSKKGFIKSMSTIYVYVFIGTIFEIAFVVNDGNKGGGVLFRQLHLSVNLSYMCFRERFNSAF
jgi:ABC-type arginine/histidine transport system permease subunit